MRLNRLFLCLLAASCALSLRCERSDVITGAGSGVVSDMDPSLTDTRKGFALIKLDAGAVDSTFSLPAAADPASSTQAAGYVLIGVSDPVAGDTLSGGDTLAAYMQYVVPAFLSSPPYSKDDYEGLQGAYLYFSAADTLGASEPITVYQADTLSKKTYTVGDVRYIVWLEPVNPTANPAGIVGEFTLGGAGDTCSVPLPKALADTIFKARFSDTNDTLTFAFSIVGYHGKLRKLPNPYVVLIVNKGDGKAVVRDSIPPRGGDTRFTAFEGTAIERAERPYSSQHTLRTAVFRVNLNLRGGEKMGMLDTLDNLNLLNGELINAVMAITHNSDYGNYRIVVTDDTRSMDWSAADTGANVLRSLRGQFSVAPTSEPDMPFNAHSIKTPLRNAIKRYNDEKDSRGAAAIPYIYVYLRPVAENGMILWDAPQKVEAVFTQSRAK